MAPEPFDLLAFKAAQRSQWDAASSGWLAWAEVIERGFAPVTAKLLSLGGVGPGRRVLDVGTGYGEPALSAARLVGGAGRVVGVDLSSAMLEVARRRAEGLDNVTFVEADLDALDQPAGAFDVALSRFGLMFASDRGAAFRGIVRALAPGGVLAAAVWGPPPSHDLSAGIMALSELLETPPPPPGMPGPFSMSDPKRLADELSAAGFVEVSVVEEVAPCRFGSVGEYVRFNQALVPEQMHRAVRERFGADGEAEAWGVVARAGAKYADGGGALLLPSIALCVRAVAA